MPVAAVERAGRGLDALARALGTVGQLVLGFMVVTICYDALMRYAFRAPTSWSLEINTFLIVYLALMTAADTQAHGAHIRISFLADRAGPTGRRIVRALTGIVGAFFCAVMTWRGALLTIDAWEYGERVSSGFGTPMVVPYAMLPIGFGCLGLRFALDAAGVSGSAAREKAAGAA